MTWSFKPGDRVVCVDDRDWVKARRIFGIKVGMRIYSTGTLRKGEVYTVECIGMGRNKATLVPSVGVTLVGLPWSYPASHFRPVKRTSIAALREHLNVIPARKSEEA